MKHLVNLRGFEIKEPTHFKTTKETTRNHEALKPINFETKKPLTPQHKGLYKQNQRKQN